MIVGVSAASTPSTPERGVSQPLTNGFSSPAATPSMLSSGEVNPKHWDCSKVLVEKVISVADAWITKKKI